MNVSSSCRLTCEQLVVEQSDLLLEDLLLDFPQRALHLLPPSHHVGQVTHLRSDNNKTLLVFPIVFIQFPRLLLTITPSS